MTKTLPQYFPLMEFEQRSNITFWHIGTCNKYYKQKLLFLTTVFEIKDRHRSDSLQSFLQTAANGEFQVITSSTKWWICTYVIKTWQWIFFSKNNWHGKILEKYSLRENCWLIINALLYLMQEFPKERNSLWKFLWDTFMIAHCRKSMLNLNFPITSSRKFTRSIKLLYVWK